MFKQVNNYKKIGFGLLGTMLKMSLYPIKFFKDVLPQSGTILDFGCGEGMLTNLIADNIPGVNIVGIDEDPKRIEQATKAKMPNADFVCKKIEDFLIDGGQLARAVILNDVLHHHDLNKQKEILTKASSLLSVNGLIILKEVDVKDIADRTWTTFWDTKLYPKDTLNFHSIEEWNKILGEVGLRLVVKYKVKHFWPASSTILVFKKIGRVAAWYETIKPTDAGLLNSTDTPKIVITGGTGFIGENLVRSILQNGFDKKIANVILLVRNKKRVSNDLLKCDRIKVLETNFENLSSFDELKNVDYVFHLAANADFFATQGAVEENKRITESLLNFFKGTQIKRFVYSSTMGAIDRAPNDDCKKLLNEDSEAHPISFYGRSKLQGEKMIIESGVPYTIIRVPWCYGPGMEKRQHVRFLFEKLISGSLIYKLSWPGRISLISVFELSRIVCEAAANSNTKNQIYFISDGEPITFGELFRKMGELSGVKAGHIKIPNIFIRILFLGRSFLPLTAKSLIMDALAVSNEKITQTGIVASKRGDDFLKDLFYYLNSENHPGNFFDSIMTVRPSELGTGYWVITGANSGIGLALAKQLSKMGKSLVLLDRNDDKLSEFSNHVIIKTDLSDSNCLVDVCSKINKYNVFGLINNAGLGFKKNFAEMSIEEILATIKVNDVAPVMLTRLLADNIIKNKGTIVNVASSVGHNPLPGMSIYSASKAFILNWSNSLWYELKGKCNVITFSPSGTNTNFQNNAGVKKDANASGLLTPEYVAQQVISAVEQNKSFVFLGSKNKIVAMITKFFPAKLSAMFWGEMFKKMR